MQHKAPKVSKLIRWNLKSSIRERQAVCRAIPSSEPAYEEHKSSHLNSVNDSYLQSPVALLWVALSLLIWCTQRWYSYPKKLTLWCDS